MSPEEQQMLLTAKLSPQSQETVLFKIWLETESLSLKVMLFFFKDTVTLFFFFFIHVTRM